MLKENKKMYKNEIGGGSRGSFQAGALKGLIENLEAEETQWEVITGKKNPK